MFVDPVTEPSRKLLSILAADVVGYTRLMGENDNATHTILKEHRKTINGLISARNGSVFDSAGDSVMAEFSSTVDAVSSAIDIQYEIDKRNTVLSEERRMRFRIGVHLGDVLVEGKDRAGDCVNIAARLEALATPGGVCISDVVFAQVRGRADLDLRFEDMGSHRVKNVINPVHVYRISLETEFREISPFRGLGTFEFEHSRFFHGRTHAIQMVKERLEAQAADGHAFLLIYGMSGTGKSSLVRAGLLPEFAKQADEDTARAFRYCILKPSEGSDPITALNLALLQGTALSKSADPINKAYSRQRSASDHVDEIVDVLHKGWGSNAVLLVVVDQLEELFSADNADLESQEAFVQLLSGLAKSSSVWVICTMRTDFLHQCATVPGFSELKDGFGSYELLPPSPAEIAQIIRNPAETVGLRFEENAVEGRLEDVLQRAAAQNQGSLPLLEFVLEALYQRGKEHKLLTFADYHGLGGLEGAIAKRADEILASMSRNIQETLPSVLRSLVTIRLRDKVVAARPAIKEELTNTEPKSALVDEFVRARLFATGHDDFGNAVARLSHEALLTHWPRAQDVIRADREFLEIRARVLEDAQRWIAEDQNPDLLLPSGKRLFEALELLKRKSAELDRNLVCYIEASSQRQRQREAEEKAAERHFLQLEADRAKEREANARRLATVVSLFTVVAVVIAGFALWQRNLAKEREEIALQAEEEANINHSLILASQARQLIADDLPVRAGHDALDGLPLQPMKPDRAWVANTAGALVEAINANREKKVLEEHAGNVSALALTKDKIISGSWDNTVKTWDRNKDYETESIAQYEADVLAIAIPLDESTIAVGGRNNKISIIDIDGNQKKWLEGGHKSDVLSLAYSRDGQQLASGSRDKTIQIWDVSSGKPRLTLEGHTGSIYSLAFSSDGKTIASGSRDHTIRIWDTRTGELRHKLQGHGGGILALSFLRGDEEIVSASTDDTLRKWSLADGSEIAQFIGHEGDVYALATFNKTNRLASASEDRTIRIWDLESAKQYDILKGHHEPIYALGVSPNDHEIVSGSRDNTIRIWDVNKNKLQRKRFDSTVDSIAAFPRGDPRVAAGLGDGTIHVWDTSPNRPDVVMRHSQLGSVLAVAISSDGKYLASGSSDNTVRIWRTESDEAIHVFTEHTGDVSALTFSTDDRYVISGSIDDTIRVWDVVHGEKHKLPTASGHINVPANVTALAFSNEGDIIGGSSDRTIRIWDFQTGEMKRDLDGHEGSILSIAPFINSNLIATASEDTTVRIWDLAEPGQHQTLQGHEQPVTSVSVAADGERVATTSKDRTVRIWEVRTGEQQQILHIHDGPVTSVDWSGKGAFIVSGSEDKTIRRSWVAEDRLDLIETARETLNPPSKNSEN